MTNSIEKRHKKSRFDSKINQNQSMNLYSDSD